MGEWNALPTEIQLLVAYELHEFRDLVAFLQICKTTYSLNNNRLLWTNYLEQLCQAHYIFRPSWDIPSATLPELRSLSSRPTRFERAICKGRLIKRSPVHLHPVGDGERDRRDLDAKLIPGGRWLVTVGICWSESPILGAYAGLSIWEIGYPVMKRIRLVQTVQLEGEPRPGSLEIWEDQATSSYIIGLMLLDSDI
jgi:hypothetical protein